MKIFTDLKEVPSFHRPVAVGLGTFDGLHLGHQKIIRQVVQLADQVNGVSAVFTFSNHPREIIRPGHGPKQLMTPQYKVQCLEKMGLDILVTIPFTTDFLLISPHDFLGQLQRIFRPSYVVVGPNYTYGYKGQGTSETLKAVEQTAAFQVHIVDALTMGGEMISSTRIRRLLGEGKITEANQLLGRRFRLEGNVVPGDQRGRTLGFPTANLAIAPEYLLPHDGVYAVEAYVGAKHYAAVANIGKNPTFQGTERRLEVFLLDFQGDLYDQTIAVAFLERIRGEKTFANAKELIVQIEADIAYARKASFGNLYNL